MLPQIFATSFLNPLTIKRPKPAHPSPSGGPLRTVQCRVIKRRPNLYKVPPPPRHRNDSKTSTSASKTTKFDVRSIDTFCRSIGTQIKELPDKEATDLVTEIQNLVWNRTMLVRNTPCGKPSVVKPGPARNQSATVKSLTNITNDWLDIKVISDTIF